MLLDLRRPFVHPWSQRTMTFKFTAAFLAFSLVATIAVAQAALSGADIQKLLKDKRVALSCIDGTKGSGRYTMAKNFGIIKGRYQIAGSKPAADTGTVRAQGNNLCVRFQLLNGGNESCFDVARTGAGRFEFSASGVRACTITVL